MTGETATALGVVGSALGAVAASDDEVSAGVAFRLLTGLSDDAMSARLASLVGDCLAGSGAR